MLVTSCLFQSISLLLLRGSNVLLNLPKGLLHSISSRTQIPAVINVSVIESCKFQVETPKVESCQRSISFRARINRVSY